ncbi:MAG TPA: heme-binding domain-containing protein [Aggregatilineaceae bacterium]|nr:heme-binding domain-containing protein [Aggregatilineaceae bacterium]
MKRFSTLKTWQKVVTGILGVGIVAFLIMQFVPLTMDNPAVVSEPNWDAPETRALAKDACFDCHSNETVWPWYAKIGPSRLLLWNDVHEGRGTFNFSDWQNNPMDLGELLEVIDEGEMPPWYYSMMHSNAKLSDSEKQQLMDGLARTLSAQP